MEIKMTDKRIKNLFTVNCGLGEAPKAPVFKKRGLIVWIMPWHWIAIPLIRFLKKKKYQQKLEEFNTKVAKYEEELVTEYSNMITSYFTDEATWDEDELAIIDAWSEQISSESKNALTKEAMKTIYRSKLFKEVLNKTGYSIGEVKEHAPGFIWGYDFENGWYRCVKNKKVASIVDFRFFLYTAKQLIVASATNNFYDRKESFAGEEVFYKHVGGIKTVELTRKNKHSNEEITDRYVQLTYSGDKAIFPIYGDDGESQVKCIKNLLNSKAE